MPIFVQISGPYDLRKGSLYHRGAGTPEPFQLIYGQSANQRSRHFESERQFPPGEKKKSKRIQDEEFAVSQNLHVKKSQMNGRNGGPAIDSVLCSIDTAIISRGKGGPWP